MQDRCDIVLPTIGEGGLVTGCIESLIRHTRYPYRLLVIDDGAPAEVSKRLDGFLRSGRLDMRVIKPAENLGWIRAINRGLEESKDSRYVCFQNDDTIFTEGWLEELVKVFENDPGIGIANPEWELPKGADADIFAAGLKRLSGQTADTDYCRGHCFFIRREVIDRIGGFDPAYIPAYYDDRDYSLRAIEAGYRCVKARGSFVAHIRNVSMSKAMEKSAVHELMERNGRIFYERWGYPLRLVFVLADTQGSKPLLQKMCMDQNKAIVVTTPEGLVPYHHTNMKVLRFGSFMFNLRTFAFLLARRSRKRQKGISFVFTDDKSFYSFANRFKGLITADVVLGENLGDLADKASSMVEEKKEKDRRSIV